MADDVDRTLYIKNINQDVTEGLLYELFLQAGPVDRVHIKGNIAFVTFEDEDSVLYACSLFEGTKLYGTELFVKPRAGSKFEKIRIQTVPPYGNYDSLIHLNNSYESHSIPTTPQSYFQHPPSYTTANHYNSFNFDGGLDARQRTAHSPSFPQFSSNSYGGFSSSSWVSGATNAYGEMTNWNNSLRQSVDPNHHDRNSRDFYNSRVYQGSYDRHYSKGDNRCGSLRGTSKRFMDH